MLHFVCGVPAKQVVGKLESGIVRKGIGDTYADVERYIGKCRFFDCRHEGEPGCAIQAAISAGELDLVRWESDQKLNEAVSKEEILRRRNDWSKNLSKENRRKKTEMR